MKPFPIISVPDEAPERLENVGSKEKFWYTRSELESHERWLFKANRLIIPENADSWAGEDWSEKVAAELCTLLDLPCATYELAVWMNTRGVVTRRIEREHERLVLGNELLAGHDYPRVTENRFDRIPQYTLDLTLETLANSSIGVALDPTWALPEGVASPPEAFVGFLLLDAWIANTDRHDRNWGVLESYTENGLHRYLAPTFDHASSLGRELLDEKRRERLTSRDRGQSIEKYVERARSGFFRSEGDRKTMHPVEAFMHAKKRYSVAADAWLSRLAAIDDEQIEKILNRLPGERISSVGAEFARKVLDLNRKALLEL